MILETSDGDEVLTEDPSPSDIGISTRGLNGEYEIRNGVDEICLLLNAFLN